MISTDRAAHSLVAAAALALATAGCSPSPAAPDALATATPIKHLVVIFDENVSFDHYFATYPAAQNPPGEPTFTAAASTPAVNGLSGALLFHNPNDIAARNGDLASNPFRLDRSQAATASQSHLYTAEQMAYHGGAGDLFPYYTGQAMPGGSGSFNTPSVVMGYYDGNTVTALWNYAQRFAMNDNAYSDQYGPSTPGAINLVSGQTNGVVVVKRSDSTWYAHDGQGGFTLINDVQPAHDSCSLPYDVATFTGKNIGDLLNARAVAWGWFQGGFDLGVKNPDGSTGCTRSTRSVVAGVASSDYLPHHEPFQFYPSTANPRHRRPASIAAIGVSGDSANHQYDLHDFVDAVQAGHFPAVSFLKAAAFEDGHSGYSDPLDEQRFVVELLNYLQQQADWKNTAVIILYDDSDGWYDHQFAPVANASFADADRLDGLHRCGTKGTTPQLGGVTGRGPVDGRCGPGTRQPFLVISPWARTNFVDHTRVTQASVIRFIEDNWLNGVRIGGGSFDATAGDIRGMFDFTGPTRVPALFIDDSLGTPTSQPSGRLPH
ncbi:MAG TPA: alkaline phosphatase family protein [Gemmatimonadales bacterium]